eukprot:TRINITY_DN10248_c0_g1_i1.p2 TRINITY_DN10248_c0_g1~~TRINITY_DN10248_c0_g1_i1.p2  ORF type:complete len:215 (-),score=53.50 TRINITY_DN10248_c0_g1_i1:52-696(-)
MDAKGQPKTVYEGFRRSPQVCVDPQSRPGLHLALRLKAQHNLTTATMVAAETDFEKGEKVAWNYAGAEVPGVVQDKNEGETVVNSGGKPIKRKGDEENPAYVVAMDKGDAKDGKEVAKKGSELHTREPADDEHQEKAEEKEAEQEKEAAEDDKEENAGEDDAAAAKRKADAPPTEEEKEAKAAKADEAFSKRTSAASLLSRVSASIVSWVCLRI